MRKRNVMRRVAGSAVRLLLAAFVAWHLAQAATITISGSWSRVIGAGDLTGGPGSDLPATYESATNQITMTSTATNIMTGIGSCATGMGATSGAQLTYLLSVDTMTALIAGDNHVVTITLTLTDN